ncbi:hypothetical protein K491DRAFT_723017 [Lophiostoma macrostomum CBS 122681]|uniref:Uncharacterized protein n=1 Tax=Lophiostoma macrostomum CBS 122681 TaxID=1314788 RepID=A0A6A6SJ87_9PLEO|nr:hypothetical protein K491DRAFT_723017 [Lophiostoma macrostomum CBS 122681]
MSSQTPKPTSSTPGGNILAATIETPTRSLSRKDANRNSMIPEGRDAVLDQIEALPQARRPQRPQRPQHPQHSSEVSQLGRSLDDPVRLEDHQASIEPQPSPNSQASAIGQRHGTTIDLRRLYQNGGKKAKHYSEDPCPFDFLRAEASGTPMTSSQHFGQTAVRQKLLEKEKKIQELGNDIRQDKDNLQGTLDDIERFGIQHILQQKETRLKDLTYEYWDTREVLETMGSDGSQEERASDDEIMVDVDG